MPQLVTWPSSDIQVSHMVILRYPGKSHVTSDTQVSHMVIIRYTGKSHGYPEIYW